ncbi:MAG: high-affinity branched-chain amino acid ABC transporter permease LivM [Pseudomonadota bacterium]|nr:high-affinity branched-chain amino acid ABC transporter permease LivM [Pseudomonadota bacterium]
MNTNKASGNTTTRTYIKESLITFVLAYVIFLPITGLVLKGYDYQALLHRPLYLALSVALLRVCIVWLRDRRMALPLPTVQIPAGVRKHKRFGTALLFGVMLALPFSIDNYWLTVAISVLIYILLGLGLNIVVGLAGLLDLGFVAFYAVGAYGYALGSQYLGIGFWAAIPFVIVLAMLCGILLGFPVLRMHGDYLAIVTLGFGEIIRLVLNNWLDFTGGPNGVAAPPPTLFGMEFAHTATQGGRPFHELWGLEYGSSHRYIFIYLLLLATVALALLFVNRLRQMPLGRSWEALRENEIACRSLGLNHVAIKLSAFSLGAMIGGVAGIFFAAYQGFINPSSFTFFESALILCIVVLGGSGSTIGVVLAATVITLLPEVLRDFADFRILIFGIVMVVMMIWRPRGFVTAKRQRFER